MLGPVVIGQDEQTELHVQAMIQGGRRQLDIRIWRRGPTGFAPSRNALTLESPDLDALREGITELLEASNGGQQVARVVWDKDEGRRLRAETEPFGTRFVARLGFWQRVRDTWRPAGDGLTLSADQLKPLQDVLERMRPRLLEPDIENSEDGSVVLQPAALLRWPTPGADWLTAEPHRLTFHPRGIRISATVEEDEEEQHRLVLCQWRREESLWLPRDVSLSLSVPDLDTLLLQMRHLADGKHDEAYAEIVCSAGSTVQISVQNGERGQTLQIEERPAAPEDYSFEPRLALPLEYLPRLGRTLAQSGMLLIARLSEEERAELQSRQGMEIAPVIVSDALPEISLESAASEAGAIPGQTHDGGRTTANGAQPDDQDGGHCSEEAGVEESVVETPRRLTPLGNIQLGRHDVFLYLQEEEDRHLALQWEGRTLLVPMGHARELLSALRDLYYETLRGRRRPVSTVGGEPEVRLRVHSQGSAITVELEHEIAGRSTRLVFPVGDVPRFLSVAEAAITRVSATDDAPNSVEK